MPQLEIRAKSALTRINIIRDMVASDQPFSLPLVGSTVQAGDYIIVGGGVSGDGMNGDLRLDGGGWSLGNVVQSGGFSHNHVQAGAIVHWKTAVGGETEVSGVTTDLTGFLQAFVIGLNGIVTDRRFPENTAATAGSCQGSTLVGVGDAPGYAGQAAHLLFLVMDAGLRNPFQTNEAEATWPPVDSDPFEDFDYTLEGSGVDRFDGGTVDYEWGIQVKTYSALSIYAPIETPSGDDWAMIWNDPGNCPDTTQHAPPFHTIWEYKVIEVHMGSNTDGVLEPFEAVQGLTIPKIHIQELPYQLTSDMYDPSLIPPDEIGPIGGF